MKTMVFVDDVLQVLDNYEDAMITMEAITKEDFMQQVRLLRMIRNGVLQVGEREGIQFKPREEKE